ncbi:MAG: ATP-binding protein [Tannerella sp.]|jgi:hypothetical protein|nr:ATP-binding protein [Tannerella sp.]
MTENKRELPLGINDFESIRTGGYLYVDKTEYVYELATQGKPYFLGRPRRFGKSLLLSTLKAYFLGKKELFEGLAIADLEKDWIERPVICIDLNKPDIHDAATLSAVLDSILHELEKEWGVEPYDKYPSLRFEGIIRRACEKTKKRVVVLVDNYDKPLFDTLDNKEVNDEICNILRSLYCILKSADAYLHFVMLTGVTKISKLNEFSDMNQLIDVSTYYRLEGICGITEDELTANFEPELRHFAEECKLTCEDALNELKIRYGGYHFTKKSTEMYYNPFSLLNTLSCGKFTDNWLQSDMPTFLVKMVRNAGFTISEFEDDVLLSEEFMYHYRSHVNDPTPLLYQNGYLTIKDCIFNRQVYKLGFPNTEVKYGVLNKLMPVYVSEWTKDDSSISKFTEKLLSGDVDGFMTLLQAIYAGMPNELENQVEKYYRNIIYLIFTLMGQFVQTEVHNADAVVKTPDTVFVFEFKLDETSTAAAALKQINDKSYAIPYTADNLKIVKIGVEFNTKDRTIGRWLIN